MNTTEVTKEKALGLTKGFILNPGGFGDFELESVISATQAFNTLKKSYKGDMKIINVDVCYYSAHYKENQETMEPAWRFKISGKSGESGGYLYVNAVSGELIGR